MSGAGLPLTVVIPTLDEAEYLGATLDGILASGMPLPEVLVVDGGSQDATVAIARSRAARVITAPKGRARQLNAGARASSGDSILFLHADTRIGKEHLDAVRGVLAEPSITHGSFPIVVDAPGWAFRLIAAMANRRTRLDGTPYGDQAMFCRRSAFDAAGGFPDVPILEDIVLGRTLGRAGRFHFLHQGPTVTTSARRWEQDGVFKTTLKNWLARYLWELGASPTWLHRLYVRGRTDRGGSVV